MSYRTASVNLTRDLNRSAIFTMIASSGPIARATIAKRLGLSPATVTIVTRSLIDQGLVRVAEHVAGRRGRPAMLLEIVSGALTAFGVKIAPDHVVGIQINLEAEVLERFEAPFDATEPDSLPKLARVLADWIAQGRSVPPLLGVGLGLPGVVDTDSGRLESPLLGWHGLTIGRYFEEQLGLPVVVDNDVNTLAVAERLYGRARDVENFVTVTIGRGVGLGIVASGDIYRGFHGGAGEFGHTFAEEDGRLCTCGKRGCLETVVGDPGLIAQARSIGILGPRQTLSQLRRLASEGHEGARRLHSRAGTVLGRAVANLVTVLGPELVLISGEGTEAWPYLADGFHEAFQENVFPPLTSVRVEIDPWDDAKWAVGAATLVFRASFAVPRDLGAGDILRARLDEVTRMVA